jgi:uncharacterized Zn-finger protein
VHLKKHAGNRDYVCPFENCVKAFYEKGNLKTHLRLHTGEKPYHCSAVGCTKAFATQGHLNDHFSKTHLVPQKGGSATTQANLNELNVSSSAKESTKNEAMAA